MSTDNTVRALLLSARMRATAEKMRIIVDDVMYSNCVRRKAEKTMDEAVRIAIKVEAELRTNAEGR